MSKNNNTATVDEQVLALFNKVQDKKRKLSVASTRTQWLTSCTIGYNPETLTDRINIQTVTDTSKLIDIYAFLLQKKDYWDRACSTLAVKKEFKWMGYSLDDWETDIKSRMESIGFLAEKKELGVLEERLNKLITTEQRRALELEELQKMIGND